MSSHYELLQLPATASADELRRSFRSLSKRYHPDTTSLPTPEAEEAFRHLQEAYATLSDPALRRAYDARLQAATTVVPSPLPPLRRSEPRAMPVRRALSGGEWFALVLLALALALSLVLGLGMAWIRGTELVLEPSWWSLAEQQRIGQTAVQLGAASKDDDRPATSPDPPLQPSPAGP